MTSQILSYISIGKNGFKLEHQEAIPLEGFGPHERSILKIIAGRLSRGRSTYGEWQKNDVRDDEAESLEEIADALIYAASAIAKRII